MNINEAVWCTIQLKNNDKMLLGVVYRSPNSSFDNSSKIINLIPNLSKYVGYSHCLLTGDFNFPNISWTALTSLEGDQSLSARFLNTCEDGFLTQHATKPTRHRIGQSSSLLDLVFTSDPEMVEDSNINHLAPLGSSEHEVSLWNVICYLEVTEANSAGKEWNYLHTNIPEMKEYLTDINWANLLSSNNVNDNWLTLKNIILDAQSKFVPRLCNKKSNNKPPWLKKSIHKQIKKKQAAFKQYLRTKSENDYHSYQIQRNKAKQVIRKAKMEHESSIISDLKSNPKWLHKYIRQKQKVKHAIGPLKRPDGSITTTNEECAEALACFFKSVFIHEDLQDLPDFPGRVNDAIPNLIITEELVYQKISKVNATKAIGPDQIHPYILATFCEHLCKPLCLIYNQSLQLGQLPEDWKLANVTPVFKNGQRNLPNNYRPISLTSQACKVLESIIRDHIITFLSDKNIFCTQQHGFTYHKSCFTNLLETFED